VLPARRGPAIAHTTTGRLPLGTPTTSDNSSHSHIRVVPRADDETRFTLNNDHDKWVPTYSSPSFLQHRLSGRNTQVTAQLKTDSSVLPKTFADMARLHCPNKDEGRLPTQSSSSVAGLVTLQPSRKAGPTLWRSTRIVAPGEIHGADCDNDNVSPAARSIERLLSQGRSAPASTLTTPQHVPPYRDSTTTDPTRASLEHRPLIADTTDTTQRPTTLPGTTQDNKETATLVHVSDQYDELFGKLPDTIRLHEQLGKFDGQVVFIGHPNRDVSAHQWSASSFQWENIGRYTYSRGKVEGSLACDRVKDHDSTRSALLSFKLAAENREKLIVESGRAEEVANMFRPKSPNIVETIKPTSTAKDVRVQDSKIEGQAYTEVASRVPTPLFETIKKVQLEDPFVTKADESNSIQSGLKIADVKGSLDFQYEFPVKTMTSSHPRGGNTAGMTALECDQSSTPRTVSKLGGRLFQPGIRETNVGDEAAGRFAFSSGRGFPIYRAPTRPSKAIDSHRKLGNTHVLGEHFQNSDGLRKLVSRSGLQPTARSLFPIPGLTVANPHRIIPQVDTAVPENTATYTPFVSSKIFEPERTAVKPVANTVLQFSDPDGIRQAQGYEIVNGLGRQQPTTQNFKGPFFTASKPTTNDPTASLAVPFSEEEKLRDWFQDGHRLARQHEYATTLMSTAANGGRSRHLGDLGEVPGVSQYNYILNTLPFVRLCETLSEYVDETRNGSGKSYFTRAWKPAPAHLRDFGPDGNNSFFSTPAVGSTQSSHHGTTMKYEEQQHLHPAGLTYSHSNVGPSPAPGAVGDEIMKFKKLGKRGEL
jgi:hypothetical protein